MISLHPTGSPAETSMAHALLEIIADPAKAKKHLAALMAEKLAASEVMDAARKAEAAAKDHHDAANVKLAEANKLTNDHSVRTKQLDERHELLVAKDTRLTEYEATVATREKALGGPLAAREKAIAEREAAAQKHEAALKAREMAALDMKGTYEHKLAEIKALVGK